MKTTYLSSSFPLLKAWSSKHFPKRTEKNEEEEEEDHKENKVSSVNRGKSYTIDTHFLKYMVKKYLGLILAFIRRIPRVFSDESLPYLLVNLSEFLL